MDGKNLRALLSLLALYVTAASGCVLDAESIDSTQLALAGGGGVIAGGTSGSVPLFASFSQGAAYSGARDAYIWKANPTTNFGARANCVVDAGGSSERSCLLRWDISSIPTTARVVTASISMEVFNGSAATFPMYKLLRSWQESTVTWNGTGGLLGPWSTPGAKFATGDRAAEAFDSLPGAVAIPTVVLGAVGTEMVQGWVSSPTTNRGIIIANDVATDGIEIRTAQALFPAIHPTLSIYYRPAP